MDNTGLFVGAFCVLGIVFLWGSTAQDVKDKRAIEAKQNKFVTECAAQQDPNILDYVKRLQSCRDAAELKFKMPEYLSRVK